MGEMHTKSKWIIFEELLYRLAVKQYGKANVQTEIRRGHTFYDIGIRHDDDSEVFCDAKYYAAAMVSPERIMQAASRMQGATERVKGGLLLVVASIVDEHTRDSVYESFGVAVCDCRDLLAWIQGDRELMAMYSNLIDLEQEGMSLAGSFPTMEAAAAKALLALGKVGQGTVRNAYDSLEHEAKTLVNRLAAIDLGKAGNAIEYENVCLDICRFLFGECLTGWQKQQYSSENMNRLDFVCRITSETSFWHLAARYLGSLFVVFECKNHAEPITQGEILTTEKYLLGKALRRIAIIITRKGCDQNAGKMIAGAMRENGYLMLVLDDEDLHHMINMVVDGEVPSDYLLERAEGFLLKLAR